MKKQLTVSLFGAILAWPAIVSAYCQTTTCAQQNPPPECDPGIRVGSCQKSGIPLRWGNSCVSFSVQKDGSENVNVTADQLEAIVRESFNNWQNAACPDGGTPNMFVETYPQVDCSETRYNQNDGNQNVWLFRDDSWPHEGGGDRTIALTLVSFSPKTGQIYDVDVELNSYQRNFKLDSVGAGDDLLSVVQHESGHFLGLAHSDINEATMWLNYSGSLEMRTLEADDVEGICSVYPPVESPDPTCNADPRHGFSTQCSGPPDSSGCSIAPAGTTSPGRNGGLLAAALGLLLLTRNGRRRRPI